LDDPAESGGGQAAYEDEGEDGTEVWSSHSQEMRKYFRERKIDVP
jgi:hypothetical protein